MIEIRYLAKVGIAHYIDISEAKDVSFIRGATDGRINKYGIGYSAIVIFHGSTKEYFGYAAQNISIAARNYYNDNPTKEVKHEQNSSP